MINNVFQGDIYLCNLSIDSIDHEQKGTRPCIVMSANIRNEKSDNVFIFPITHIFKKWQPCHYVLKKEKYNFFDYKNNIVLCEEGRSVSKSRLIAKIGNINYEDILGLLKCKEYVFIEKSIDNFDSIWYNTLMSNEGYDILYLEERWHWSTKNIILVFLYYIVMILLYTSIKRKLNLAIDNLDNLYDNIYEYLQNSREISLDIYDKVKD